MFDRLGSVALRIEIGALHDQLYLEVAHKFRKQFHISWASQVLARVQSVQLTLLAEVVLYVEPLGQADWASSKDLGAVSFTKAKEVLH